VSAAKWFTLAVSLLVFVVSLFALDTSIRLYRLAKQKRDRQMKGPPS
jgi:hypothetical protein